MNDPTPTDTPSAAIRIAVDEAGLPILDQAVEEAEETEPDAPPAPAEAPGRLPPDMLELLKGELGAELEGQLQLMVREAFTESVKRVALDLKRSFERRLDGLLEERLDEIIERTVKRADRQSGSDD